ncbi:hypothetical protein [uncultured Dialister sp.]|uniref:hypothetical protein n=1 Tax=uncultured Dialister sp. TaxID=278064 RepID=UPI0025858B75|nr:hypothetical protein [uncultured Dialister sp.]
MASFDGHVFSGFYDEVIFGMKDASFCLDGPFFRKAVGFGSAKRYVKAHAPSGFVIRFGFVHDFPFRIPDIFQIAFCHGRSDSICFDSLSQGIDAGHIPFHGFYGFHIVHVA